MEYVFLSCLIPSEPVQMIDLEGKLQLEYYKLQKTFEGSIALKEVTGVYTPANARSVAAPEETHPLDEISFQLKTYNCPWSSCCVFISVRRLLKPEQNE